MYEPPLDPRDPRASDEPSWRAVLVSYAAMAAIPLFLWVFSQPLAGTVVGAVAVLIVGLRRASRLVHCFVDCGGLAVDVGGKVRVCIMRPDVDAACG